jgi:hypothetical protein
LRPCRISGSCTERIRSFAVPRRRRGTSSSSTSKSWPISSRNSRAASTTNSAAASSRTRSTARSARSASCATRANSRSRAGLERHSQPGFCRGRVLELEVASEHGGRVGVLTRHRLEQLAHARTHERHRVLGSGGAEHRRRVDHPLDRPLEQAQLGSERKRTLEHDPLFAMQKQPGAKPDQLVRTANLERRRLLLERIGYESFLDIANAKAPPAGRLRQTQAHCLRGPVCELEEPNRLRRHPGKHLKLPDLLTTQAVTWSLDLAKEPIREVPRIHQEVRCLRTAFASVAEHIPDGRRK